MIRVKCPQCRNVLGIDDANAGAIGVCPACTQKFRIPGPNQFVEEIVPEAPLVGEFASLGDDDGPLPASSHSRPTPTAAKKPRQFDEAFEVIESVPDLPPRRAAPRPPPAPPPAPAFERLEPTRPKKKKKYRYRPERETSSAHGTILFIIITIFLLEIVQLVSGVILMVVTQARFAAQARGPQLAAQQLPPGAMDEDDEPDIGDGFIEVDLDDEGGGLSAKQRRLLTMVWTVVRFILILAFSIALYLGYNWARLCLMGVLLLGCAGNALVLLGSLLLLKLIKLIFGFAGVWCFLILPLIKLITDASFAAMLFFSETVIEYTDK